LRLPIDTTPGRRTFVYDYLKDDFLHLVKTNLSMGASRQILKTTLKAIAELHSRDIVHLGIRGKLEGRT
jgi:serine/threonine protein kinase